MKKIDLNKPFAHFLFNPDRCQVVYDYGGGMKPEDHGYYPGMSAYHDFEDDLCVSRNFDNPVRKLMGDGFLFIVPDNGNKNNATIKLSEVYKILKKNKPTKPKLYANIKKTEDAKVKGMTTLSEHITNAYTFDTPDVIGELFKIAKIINKNTFSEEEFKKFYNKK